MSTQRVPFKPDTIYHIYNHSIGASNLFMENSNYDYFLDLFKKHVAPFAEVYAFCLMPNHFHFLLRIGSEDLIEEVIHQKKYRLSINNTMNINQKLSHLMGNMFNAYAKGINKRYHRMGGLFISRVKRKIVCDKDYLKQLILYINTNPAHHGITEDLEEWHYSSYTQILHGNSCLLACNKSLSFFESKTDFQLLHRNYLEESSRK